MLLGTFNGTLYQFGGKWYKPKFFAHSGRMSLDEMKPILEAGHAQGVRENSYPRGILLASQTTWNSKIAGTPYAATWGDLCQLHYCFYGQPIGNAPTWAASFKGYNHLLIHEYEDGKVAYLRSSDPEELYAFFTDAATPGESTPEPITPQNKPITAGDYVIDIHITGTITRK